MERVILRHVRVAAAWLALPILATAITWGTDPPSDAAAAPRLDVPMNVDRPLGELSCDRLGIAQPLPTDIVEDERVAPNHCRVRLFSFPSLAPLDLPLEAIELRGATNGRRIAPGEYLFENVALSYTSIVVRDVTRADAGDRDDGEAVAEARAADSGENGLPPAPPPEALAHVGRRRTPPIASRNPLLLARHATTLCDLYVAQATGAEASIELRGTVVDRVSGAPVEGAQVRCGGGAGALSTVTGADGRYRFEAPIRWQTALEGLVVTKAGYAPSSIHSRLLPSIWVDRWRLDGTADFLLFPAERSQLRSPLLPSLWK